MRRLNCSLSRLVGLCWVLGHTLKRRPVAGRNQLCQDVGKISSLFSVVAAVSHQCANNKQ